MVRPVWVIIGFAAGIALGFGVARWGGAEAPATPADPPVAVHPRPPARVSPPEAPATGVSAAAKPVAAAPQAQTPPPMAVSAATPDAEYAGYVQPVDAGPVFQKVIGQKPPPGTENRLGDLHHALEREVRDDSWAYPMEAEIQNSLVAETSAGKLAIEHLECRATLCELRLSGTSANEQSLADWSAGLSKQPWAGRLYMNLSSSVSDGERVDSLLIFRRPQK